jgi:phosphatidylglycerophosphate synthase
MVIEVIKKIISMKHQHNQKNTEIHKTLLKDRKRTNLLKKHEQDLLVFLVQRVPSWINSDKLTFIGFVGSLITMFSFILGRTLHREFLLIGIVGLAINWIGDSLDGRLAYYRNKPRKWYGFTLDFTVDWITTFMIGIGYMIYAGNNWTFMGFIFVVLYGWAMITALLRYKISGHYTIDSLGLGPTEVRIAIALLLIAEVIFANTLIYSAIIVCFVLFVIDITDTIKLLKIADQRDKEEKSISPTINEPTQNDPFNHEH